MTIKISRHFEENWRARVGGDPDPDEVQDIIDRGVRVQTGGLLLNASGLGRERTLSIFWCPEANVVLKVDEGRGVAVTVLSANDRRKPRWRRVCGRG